MISNILSFLGHFYPARRGRWTLSRHCRKFCHGSAVTRLRCGASMLVDRGNAVDRVIYLFGEYDREEINWMISNISDARQTLFYDIGANIGAYSVILPTLIPGLKVHAFEPDLRNLIFLKANITINGLEECVGVHDVAVGDVSGSVQFLESRGGDLLNTGKSKVVGDAATKDDRAGIRIVRKVALDDHAVVYGRTILMKIDVEGFEFNVLKGMCRTLRDNNCFLMIEIFPENLNRCDILMESLGYRRTNSFGSDDWAYERINPLND